MPHTHIIKLQFYYYELLELHTCHNFLKYFIINFFAQKKKKKTFHNIHFPCYLIFKNIFTILFVLDLIILSKKNINLYIILLLSRTSHEHNTSI